MLRDRGQIDISARPFFLIFAEKVVDSALDLGEVNAVGLDDGFQYFFDVRFVFDLDMSQLRDHLFEVIDDALDDSVGEFDDFLVVELDRHVVFGYFGSNER